MRLIFAGTPDLAVPSLDALIAAGHDIVAVLTQPDAPGKRGSALLPSAVKVAAQERGLLVLTPERASRKDLVEQLRSLEADAAAVVAYGQILKAPLLGATRLGWVNLHFSILPAWRGAAPVQRAIQAGDDVTGATTFVLDEGMDTGPVIGQLVEFIRPGDTAGDLLERLSVAGAPLLVESLEALNAGTARPQVQEADGVSHAAKLTREDARVRWELPSHVVDRLIRACSPAPGAWTTLPDGTPARIGPVQPVDAPPTTPGLVVRDGKDVLVGTGTGAVRLSWIQPAGKGQLPADAWLRGVRVERPILGES